MGGQRLVMGEQAYTVRGIGLIRDVHDIEGVVISEQHGVPTRVRDIASIQVGAAPRLGIVGHDEDPDMVQGVVLMRYGGETQPTLEGIHKRIDFIRENHILPPGMDIVPYYDRGNLVKLTTHTVLENLVVGMLLVSIVLFLFLGHTREAAIITALNIPLALLVAFCGLVGTNTSANLISLGAVDFGIVVDSTVIMMENIFRHLGPHGKGSMSERILQAAREVAGPMTFSTLIIGVAFLPLFTMTGVAGVIFSPMAMTYAFAIGGAIVLALTLTPVLAAKFVPAQTLEKEPIVMRALHAFYRPLFGAALRWPKRVLVIALVPVLVGMFAFRWLGGEFMPHLEEGNFWIRATLPMSISLEQSSKYVRADARDSPRLPRRPQCSVRRCTSQAPRGGHGRCQQLGRPDDGTDVAGFQNIELFAPLKSFDEWPRGLDEGHAHRRAVARSPTRRSPWRRLQLLADDQRQHVEEAVSGVKGENSVKVFGSDSFVANGEERPEHPRRHVHRPGHQGLGHVQLDGAAQRHHHTRPRGLLPLRVEHRETSSRSCRQPSVAWPSRRCSKREKRFDLTVRMAGAIPQLPRINPRAHHLDPGGRKRSARPNCEGDGERGAEQHLPRRRAAVHASQIQRPRARPREHHRRCPGANRQAGAPSLRLAPRLGGRDQSTQGGRRSPEGDLARDAAPHRRSSFTAP